MAVREQHHHRVTSSLNRTFLFCQIIALFIGTFLFAQDQDKMSDNLANLRNYQIQLEQVETALVNDAENEELKKLRADLTEVIELTMQLMEPEELQALQRMQNASSSGGPKAHNFKAGDYVKAPLSEDGQFYEAQIEDITSDGQCTVVFHRNKKRITEVCLVELLKPIVGRKRPFNSSGASSGHPSTSSGGSAGAHPKRPQTEHEFKDTVEQREALKKKQAKKKEKLKSLEDEREKDKAKWQSFANKAAHKHFKGTTKKSIFTTPESVHGRVGVGTCGVGGKPMTEYQQIEKVRAKSARSNLPMPFDEDRHHRNYD